MGKNKPNIVFIMADQQRADSFGPERHPCANYPTLETLAGESVVFSNFFTAASACVPSRHTFLTGRQPWILGCSGNTKFSMDNAETWMSILREQGYACVSVGKTHMVHAGSFHIQIPVGKTFGDQKGWDHFHPAASPETEENYFDIHATRRACEVVEELKDDGPFALFLGFHAPHEPYVMPRKYLDFCRPEDVTLPESCYVDEYDTKSSPYRDRFDHFKSMFGEITDEDIKKGIAGHHCLLKMVDDCLNTLLQTLEKNKLLDKTYIVYCSDHGDVLGEHRIFNKAATFYDSEVRIPMMIRFPDGSHKGKRLTKLASSIDFAPTLYEILRINPDVSLPGRSLMPLIEHNENGREHVTCSTYTGMMIRTEKYKLWKTLYTDGEMYDIENDPKEMINLYNDPSFKDLRFELTERMLNSRIEDDLANNKPTKYEHRIYAEVKSSGEPEVPRI